MTSVSVDSYHNFYRKVTDFRGNLLENTLVRVNFDSTQTGNSVKGWREKLEHHQDASSDYGLTKYNVKEGRYRASYYCSDGLERVDDTYYPNVPWAAEPANLASAVYNTALGNFLSNAHDVVAPFKGLTFIGELKETLRMLRNPASSLRNGISHYLRRVHRRGRSMRGDLRQLSKMVTGTWLEYCYGWKPLLKSIEDAANAYSQHKADVQYLRAYGKAETKSATTNAPWKCYFANYGSYMVERTQTASQKVVFKGVVRIRPEIQVDPARTVARLSGFGIEEFIPTVWELIPYSFVADYFTNIGTILNSAIPLFYDWVWWSCATTRKATQDIIITPGEKSPWSWGWSEMINPGHSEKVIYSRSKPVLSLPTPQLELPGSNWSWANLAALAGQKIVR